MRKTVTIILASIALAACGSGDREATGGEADLALPPDPMFEGSGANDITAVDAAALGETLPPPAEENAAEADGTETEIDAGNASETD